MTGYLDPTPPVRRRLRSDPYAEGENPAPDEPADAVDDDLYEGRDLPSFIPARLRRAIDDRRDRWTRIDTFAAAIIGLQLFVLFIEVVRGSLYLDDLRAQAYALDQPFWSFIMGSNGTHFAPLPRILDWVQSRAFPLDHGPAVVITLVVRLLLAGTFWRLLRRLFGPRLLTLLPLAILGVTPAMLPASLWYRQSITIVACTAAMLWALDAHLRWLLDHRRGALAEVVIATAAGVCCYEKAAALPIVLAAATIAIFGRIKRRPRPASATPVRNPAILSVLLSSAVVVTFLVIYRSGHYDQAGGARPSVVDVLHLSWDTATRDLIPLILGGPYHWNFSELYAGTAHLSTTAIAITLVIAGVALLTAALRRPSPVSRGLLFLLAWMIPSVAIVALGRFDSLQLVLADATRLWVDLVPAFLLAVALAALPWEVGACRSRSAPRPSRPAPADSGSVPVAGGSPGTAAAPGTADPAHSRRSGRREPSEVTVPALAVGLAFVIIAAGSAASTVSYVSKWWDNPTGAWLSNMKTSVAGAEPFARVLATPLPDDVMPAWVSSQLPTGAPLMQLIRDDLRFNDGDGPARALNPLGTLSPILQAPLGASKPAVLCAKRIPVGRKGSTGLRLAQPALYGPGAQLEVGVLLGEVTPVRVQILTADNRVLTPSVATSAALPTGGHVLHYPVPIGERVAGAYVTTNATKVGCITNIRVWAPVTSS